MTWIFGSFLVTRYALASCHILIRKQEDYSTIGAVGYNRCVTRRRPRHENHAVRFRQSAENRCRARDTQPIRGVAACKGMQACTCRLLEEYMGRRSPPSEYISLHPSLTHHRNINPFENKVWEIYYFKEVCSFVHWIA